MRRNKNAKVVLNFVITITILTASLLGQPVYALGEKNDIIELPAFADFVKQVQDGNADELRGVYVTGVFAMPVVQQPINEPNYVSIRDGEVTQFSTASHFGNVGLLAHNTLSGKHFSQLEVGAQVHLVFGDGTVKEFVVTEILQFQALSSRSYLSDFRSLNGDGTLSASELFMRVYSGEYHVTFQTCIQAGRDLSWGRMFVIAEPVSP